MLSLEQMPPQIALQQAVLRGRWGLSSGVDVGQEGEVAPLRAHGDDGGREGVSDELRGLWR